MHFPNRFHLIIGDSTFTLPKFRRQNPSIKSDLSNTISMSHYKDKHTYIIIENMHKKDVNRIWHSAISQGFIDNPTYTDDSFMPCVTINPSNYEVLPCPE